MIPPHPSEILAMQERIDSLERENQSLRERVSGLVDEKYRMEYLLREYNLGWALGGGQ